MPTISVNNTELYYESSGSGPTLLFLHGLGSSTRDWEYQVPALEGNYRVITVDARGHGQSASPPGPYSVAQMASDVTALLRQLEAAPAHIVGLSMGGMLAFQMAVDAPDVVRSLTIVNSGPELKPKTFQERLAIWQRLVIFRLLSMRRIGEVIGGRLFPEPHQAALKEIFVNRWAENDKRAYMDATRALAGWGVREQIGGIRQPTLVISADMDYTPVALKQAYVDEMPNARLVVIKNARHATNVDSPDEFNRVVAEFLREIEAVGQDPGG